MPTFDITIDGKTYQVDIPWLGLEALPVVVDGRPFEVRIAGGLRAAPREARQSGATDAVGRVAAKPVKAEWHASIRAE